MTTSWYAELRDRIAVRLCNLYHFPAGGVDDLVGWAPMFQRHADELIAMMQEAIEPEEGVEVFQTWYRSLQSDGSLWCESSNAHEVAAMSEGIATRFERRVSTMVTGGWEPWTPPSDGDA